jgi:hypothetical protein
MPRRTPKLASRIAHARHLIEQQQALLARRRINGQPTREVEAASLEHLLAHNEKMKRDAEAKKEERLKKRKMRMLE